jgi:sterol desaturase/sphingolipid hydroxylase (fatty acid hydroxylase superfamily)
VDKLDTFFDLLRQSLANYWGSYISAASKTNLAWWLVFFLVGSILYYKKAWNSFSSPTFLGAFRYCFPKKVFGSKSTFNDVSIAIFNSILITFLPLLQLAIQFNASDNSSLTQGLAIDFFYSLCAYLAFDLGFYLQHFLSHKTPILWDFHKVHHSAKVMSPLTNLRLHVVDFFQLSLIMNGSVFLTSYVFNKLGYAPHAMVFFGFPLFLILHNWYGILAHSHIWISFGRLSHIFYSPAMHQIHHSMEARHLNKNFGYYLSVWDWLFGSIYIPKHEETFEIGLVDDKDDEWNSKGCLFMTLEPFRSAFRRVISNG